MTKIKLSFLTDSVWKLFKHIRFSDEGSNTYQREQEQWSYMMFLDYLDECEKSIVPMNVVRTT